MIYVCNLEEMPRHAALLAPGHLISLLPTDEQPPTPPNVAAERHLRVEVHDISEPLPGHVLPAQPHIEPLIDFLQTRAAEQPHDPLLIHCWAGVSRSMATALIALCLEARGREVEAAVRLRRAAPHAQPNRRIVELADQLLGRRGRLTAALEAMGPATYAMPAPLVRLEPLD